MAAGGREEEARAKIAEMRKRIAELSSGYERRGDVPEDFDVTYVEA